MASRLKGWTPYLAILAVLIALLFYTQWRQRSYEVQIEPIFKIDEHEIVSFTVSKDTLSVSLVRNDTAWTFAGKDTGRVAEYRINDFVRNVLKGQREGFVSEDTSNVSAYGLGAKQAVQLTLELAGGTTVSASFGRSPTDYSSEFVRYEGNPMVFPLRQKTVNSMGTTAAWWR